MGAVKKLLKIPQRIGKRGIMTEHLAPPAPEPAPPPASPYVAALLDLIDRYKDAAHGSVEDKTASYRIFGDTKKVTALRQGADLTTARVVAAAIQIRDIWPNAQAPSEAIDRLVGEASLQRVGGA